MINFQNVWYRETKISRPNISLCAYKMGGCRILIYEFYKWNEWCTIISFVLYSHPKVWYQIFSFVCFPIQFGFVRIRVLNVSVTFVGCRPEVARSEHASTQSIRLIRTSFFVRFVRSITSFPYICSVNNAKNVLEEPVLSATYQCNRPLPHDSLRFPVHF